MQIGKNTASELFFLKKKLRRQDHLIFIIMDWIQSAVTMIHIFLFFQYASIKIRKPAVPAALKAYLVPKDLENVPFGVLDVPASQWTRASKVVSALDTQITQSKNFDEVYSPIINAFSKLSKSPEKKSVTVFAEKCEKYASSPMYRQECKDSYELKKTELDDLGIELKILNLSKKGIHSAIEITNDLFDKVT